MSSIDYSDIIVIPVIYLIFLPIGPFKTIHLFINFSVYICTSLIQIQGVHAS